MTELNIIKQHFTGAQEILNQFMAQENNFRAIHQAGTELVAALRKGNKIITCGNGGSMCDAMHFAEELSGKYREERAALPAMAISDPSYMSCVSNDYGYNHVFARYIEAFGKEGDVLVGISTSGNSANVLAAAIEAKKKGMRVIVLSGKDGGKLKDHCDVEIRAPHSRYADHAQEIHIKVIHCLIGFVEQNLFQ